LEIVLKEKDLSKLKTINADNCDIKEISENEFPLCLNLERLWLNNNRIENLDLLLETISHCCPNLLHLSLLGNPCCPINDSKLYKEYQYKVKKSFLIMSRLLWQYLPYSL
jgi:Leucine-rich repeat (LRR) protein